MCRSLLWACWVWPALEESGLVEKATMQLKPSLPAPNASASLAKSVVKHTPRVA